MTDFVPCIDRLFNTCCIGQQRFNMTKKASCTKDTIMPGETRKKILFLTYLSLWTVHCSGSNIILLTANSVSSPSHYMVLSTITGGLVANGHNVTIVTNDAKGTYGFPNGTYSQALTFKASYTKEEMEEKQRRLFQEITFELQGKIEKFKCIADGMNLIFNSCLDFWRDVQLLAKVKKSSFDFALVFPFSSCDILMVHYINIPFAVLFPSVRAPTFHEGYIEKSIKELYSHASLYLAHVSLGSDFPRPYTQNFIPIGGLITQPSKRLPKELEEFVEGSGDHGVIVFTLGSVIKSLPNNDLANIFARVFRKLPQRVIWRHNSDQPENLSNNTKLLKWLPQNDLLGHPKTRLLIYHGGSNGVLEAISHGVPMVIIPMFVDQFTHAARVQKKGMGLMIDKANITEESVMAAVQEVLNNPSYKERAQLFSDIHNDLPMKPLERAVYWIEHVMKFGGAHLRPRSADMNFIELYMIDVAIFLIIVSAIGLYVDYLILSKLFRMCCKTDKEKQKSE
ncbi:putative UDP-glucuronosyltransferase 2C1 [Apostichopus japonicus]|uniref:Putative UDP-glucuronosyltransferase 2C1 n=1 Tax=Stichopus japonicus TaxID=307972 RepID=A0A2G8LMY2_STIJA|nr:putative UDP-glucuronosyltransferase 2C1 [Apostichopus japonicus]